MKTIGLPIEPTGELTAVRLTAAWLGRHSGEVLRTLGYCDSDSDVAALFEAGVGFDRDPAPANQQRADFTSR